MLRVTTAPGFSLILILGIGLTSDTALPASSSGEAPLAGAVTTGGSATQDGNQRESEPRREEGGEAVISPEQLGWHMPDPEAYRVGAPAELERARHSKRSC